MTSTSYSYQLQEPHGNSLPADSYVDDEGFPCAADAEGAVYRPGLPCDGTVHVTSTDDVCYALISFIVNGALQPPQRIMNVPYKDATRLPLYMQYFVNDQARQIGG